MALPVVVTEAFSFLSVEMAMFCIATMIYAVVTGKMPGMSQGTFGKGKKFKEEDEEEAVSRELKERLAVKDHHAAFRLWQRMKSFDHAPKTPANLVGVVRAMRALGKSDEEIVGELRSGLECCEALGQGVPALLEALRREGDGTLGLLTKIVALLEARSTDVAVEVYESLIAAQLRRRNFGEVAALAQRRGGSITPRMRVALLAAAAQQSQFGEALQHLEQLPVETGLPQQVVSRLLALALKEQQLAELMAKLQGFQLSLETRTLDDLLAEGVQQRDVATCRQLQELAVAWKVPRGPRTYELLCRGLADDAASLRTLFEEMVAETASQGLPEAAGVAILRACAASHDADLAERVFEALRPALSQGEARGPCEAAVLAFAACELHEKACDVYDKEMAPRDLVLDAQLRSVLLQAATKAGRPSLQEMLAACSASDVEKHATMIKSCGSQRNLQGAKRVFDNLKRNGMPMNALIYNCLIDACLQCGDAEGALEHFEQMKQLDLADVVSYNTVLRAHLGLGRFEEAQALLKEMARRGQPANQVSYSEFLRALTASKDRRAVWNLVDDMQASSVPPDASVCSILLRSLTEHSHSTDVTRTVRLLSQMEEPMNEVLFTTAAEVFIRIRRLDQLSELLRQVQEKGCDLALTAPCYGSMIKAYGNAGDVEHVWQLWREMMARSVRPTSITVGCTVDALVKNSRVEDAWSLVQEISADEERSHYVNTVIYSTVLKGFSAARQPGRLFSVHAEMRKRGVPCNTITYNTMIDACARSGSMDRVSDLLEEMKRDHVELDVITYSTLIKGYCNAGDVDKAFKVLAEMKSDGKLAPDEILYNSLLDGCAKQNRVDDAVRLLKDMSDSGVVPSNFTLSIMVKLMGRAKRLGEAFQLVDDLAAMSGVRPNVHVYTCLVQACVQNRKIDRALKLHETMLLEAGCQPDEKFYSTLARGCLQVGAVEKAQAVVRCACHLRGHAMAVSKGAAPGVEAKVVDEVVTKLNAGNSADKAIAAELSAELRAAGIDGRRQQGTRSPQSGGRRGR